MGVKVLQQYALLGTYDFLTILEAPDEVDGVEGRHHARVTRAR